MCYLCLYVSVARQQNEFEKSKTTKMSHVNFGSHLKDTITPLAEMTTNPPNTKLKMSTSSLYVHIFGYVDIF